MHAKLKKILKAVFNLTDSEIDNAHSRDDIASWDSLKHMELVILMEREFHISLTVEEIIELETISDIQNLLLKKGMPN